VGAGKIIQHALHFISAAQDIIGIKSLDFEDFCKIEELMKSKEHLTKDFRPPLGGWKVGSFATLGVRKN